jgi:hypothetical protein
MKQFNGYQPGDPRRGVETIIKVVTQEGDAAGRGIPERLPLAEDCSAAIRKKCEDTLELLKQWEDISSSTHIDA